VLLDPGRIGRLGKPTEFANMALDQTELAQIVSAVIQALKVGDTSAKPAAVSAPPVDTLAQKDRALVAGFKRKGIPVDQIKLMDRSNPKAEFNVKPFRLWLEAGRQVRKGQKSIKGLFHVSQTDPIKSAAKAQPAVPAAQKALFAEAKRVFAKKSKTQPTLV
jgi:hypothetical protein